MSQLKPGSRLRGGTYFINKVLGQGSFGITYMAEHTILHKTVAIKEFFMKELNSRAEDGSITGMTDGSLSFKYAEKFRKEAANLARMKHPNIVEVTDAFEDNGTCYYVMDFVEGENLNDYIRSHRLSENEAVSIARDIANALQYMHEQHRMLHLDLKPGNVMRRRSDGHIFLIDFGLSKHYSNGGQPETSTTIGLGTPGYAPIEQGNQAKDGDFRPTIDIYALGATLFKLLTGNTPPNASEIAFKKDYIQNELTSKGMSTRVTVVVSNAMAADPSMRTATARDFISQLSSLIAPVKQEETQTFVNQESTRTSVKKEEPRTSVKKEETHPKNNNDDNSGCWGGCWNIILLFALPLIFAIIASNVDSCSSNNAVYDEAADSTSAECVVEDSCAAVDTCAAVICTDTIDFLEEAHPADSAYYPADSAY
ncbi:MAG: serine/threonine protein kinase [Muribaculaceae bacterium]|nr:serine/threonine protein kinase [Muribaculaceae bacterium]